MFEVERQAPRKGYGELLTHLYGVLSYGGGQLYVCFVAVDKKFSDLQLIDIGFCEKRLRTVVENEVSLLVDFNPREVDLERICCVRTIG